METVKDLITLVVKLFFLLRKKVDKMICKLSILAFCSIVVSLFICLLLNISYIVKIGIVLFVWHSGEAYINKERKEVI